ncbi:MAG TPA: hypothetical protein VI461_01315 [Chitinophagaceae bacterium]|nr:hypothetical protein [Chitinophagaceae bacterium]
MNDVFGNSSSNTITFRSLATDSTAVKLVNNSTSNSSYVIQLQGTDYVSIEYMTIERDFGNGTGNTIFINSGVNNFTVKSCRVLGARISSSSGIHASARFESNFIKATFVVSALNGIIFRKNTIDQSTIIFLSFNTGLICNNDFEDCEVYINNANLCRVENNYFSETQLSLTDNLVINISNSICNNVFVSDNTVPLSIRSINTLIAYNSFRVDDVSCMLFTNSRNIGNNRFINNNLFRLNGSGIITYNEIGFNTSFALQFQQFDYNNYYTYSSDYTYILNQFQANFGKDLHSTVINPVFTSSTDLHMQNMALSGTGLPISGLNFDLDSTLRNTLHPTVGAYETFADSTFEELVDLEIIGIPSIQVGVNMVKVKVCQKIVSSPYSFVADIDSLHLQIIYGNFNTNQFTEYLDTLLEISVDVLKPSDTIVYTFNEQIDIPKGRSMMFNFMASYKNNIYETQLSNNELSILYNLPMLGVYTVGGANGDFDSIAHAQRNIRLCGAFGDGVTFNIRPGAYHLNPVGDPIFTDGPKNESPSTVFYRSESGNRNDVILYCSRMSACNDFGFRNVTFIAYDDTITDFETNYDHRGIEIFASHNLSFDSCLFHSANTFNSYSGLSFINCGSMTIRNCDFKNLYAGVYYPNAMYEPNQNQTYGLHQIENCTFDSVDYGIKCNSHNWLFASQLELMNNHIRSFFESIHYQSFPYASPLNMLVHNNDCISESGGGLYISRQNNINRVEIVNNFFAGDSALSINECEVVFNHNSCRSSSFFRQASKLEAFNNSFYSDSAVPAFVFISDNPINNSSFDCNLNCLDYNNYYTEDSSLVLVIDLDGSNYDSYSIQDSQSKLGSDSNSVSVNPSYVSSHDLHTQTSALVGLGKNVNVLIDIDGEPRDPFQPNIGADEFYPLLAYVWPGDADNNGIVNAFDLFPIGVHYYDSGYSRSVQNTIWSAHLATDWPTYQFNAQNKKYADCNGDGIINSDDVPSITQNYLFSHNAANMQLQTSVNGEPRLFFKGANGVQHPGDTVTLELWLGQSSNQLAAIYSVGADFTFSSGLIASESMSFTMDSAWIDPVEGLSIVKLNETAGTGQFSATRVSQTDTSGFGRLGVLKFQIATSIMQDTMAEFQFSGYIALNSVGTPINLRFGIKEINIHANNARVAAQIYGDSLRTIRLYPNPVTSSATLQIETEANEPIEIIINDVNGRAVYGFMAKEVITGISYYEIYPVQWGLTSGLYLVNVYSKGNLLNSIRLAVN